jgi:hypothetical protein
VIFTVVIRVQMRDRGYDKEVKVFRYMPEVAAGVPGG